MQVFWHEAGGVGVRCFGKLSLPRPALMTSPEVTSELPVTRQEPRSFGPFAAVNERIGDLY
jgi:hypothetical protein